jgi:hypothetical protein
LKKDAESSSPYIRKRKALDIKKIPKDVKKKFHGEFG